VLTVVLKNLQETIKDQATRIELQSPLPRVRADFGLLELALTNLISNALKYAPPGERPQVTVRAQGSAGRWRLEVVDRGIGIPFEDQERVFQAFVRLHGEETYEGSGLGLSIARKAVELMGGRIGVESEPGVGSTFWIELERAH
jgi:signal transduction histidine kinase